MILLAGCANGSTNPDPSRGFTGVDSLLQAVRTVRPGDSLVIPGDTTYPTVYVGRALWMARNLTYRTDTLDSLTWCPSDSCPKYGRLYDWRAAKRGDSTIDDLCDINLPIRGICPSGWHVPSVADWDSLANTLGGMVRLGVLLRSRSGCDPPMDSTAEEPKDSIGFDALPAGYRFTGDQGYGLYGHTNSDSAFFGFGTTAAFWSGTGTLPGSCSSAWGVFISKDETGGSLFSIPRSSGLSIRCVKDSA